MMVLDDESDKIVWAAKYPVETPGTHESYVQYDKMLPVPFTEEELEPALKKMLETPGPFLLDCHTLYHDHVLPMMPPGKGYKDIITE